MFLSPGEKILKYRKHYKIKQEDITGDKVSKTYLGMVECGRKSLSKKILTKMVYIWCHYEKIYAEKRFYFYRRNGRTQK